MVKIIVINASDTSAINVINKTTTLIGNETEDVAY